MTWTGQEFFVVWRTIGDTFAVRVGEDGAVLDPTPRMIDDAILAGSPEVASNGTSVLVAGGRCVAPTRGWTMRRDGSRIAELDLDLPGFSGCSTGVASDGTHYLIAADSGWSLVWRIANETSILARGERALGEYVGGTSAAWTGTEYVILTAVPALTLLRISAAGELLAEPQLLTTAQVWSVSVAGGGGSALLAWNEQMPDGVTSGVVATLRDGVLGEKRPIGLVTRTAVAGDGTSWLAAWNLPGDFDVWHAPVGSTGVTSSPIRTTHSANEQRMVSAARSSSATATAWQERRGDRTFVALSIRRNDGTQVLRSPLVEPEGLQYSPAVATDGEDFLVAWYEKKADAELRAVRVGADGTLRDAAPVIVTNPITLYGGDVSFPSYAPPAVAWSGKLWTLAWSGWQDSSLRVARITADGVPLDAGGRTVYTSPREAAVVMPQLVRGGEVMLLAFQDGEESYECRITCPTIPLGRIVAVRLDADGHLLSSAPIEVSPSDAYAIRPAAAWNGEEFLVAWTNGTLAHATRIDANGLLIGSPFVMSVEEWPGFPERLSVGALGREFLLAMSTTHPRSNVFAVRIDGSAVGEPVLIAMGAERETRPFVLATSPGSASVFFEEHGARGTSTSSVARLYFRNVYLESARRRAVR